MKSFSVVFGMGVINGRAPQGARGLKFYKPNNGAKQSPVAPRKGRVG